MDAERLGSGTLQIVWDGLLRFNANVPDGLMEKLPDLGHG
ncbi:hypothetical protein SAMN03159406_01037 [Rhizobium sp. NFR03]|nr:hypothetical protein SAMN03159406_01037 [Rhizobium sp. NFR03]